MTKERRKDHKTRTILAAIDEGVALVAADGEVRLLTEIAESLLGRSRSELIGASIYSLHPPEAESEVRSAMEKVLAGTRMSTLKEIRSGQKHLGFNLSPYFGKDGKIEGVLCILKDITELHREQERAEAILSSTADGLIVFARDGQIVHVNPTAKQMLGVDEEAVGTYDTMADILHSSPPPGEAPLLCWNTVGCEEPSCPAYGINDPRCWTYSETRCFGEQQHTFKEKMGTCPECEIFRTNIHLVQETGFPGVEEVALVEPQYRVIKIKTSPVLDSKGNFQGLVKTVQDVTAEKRVDEMKNEFVSTVSHELRTPLTSIKGYVDLILEGEAGEISETQREFLGIVKQNSERLVTLINDILDISRIESGQIQLKVGAVDMSQLISDAIEVLDSVAGRKNIELSMRTVAPAARPAAADHDRVTQVALNLMSNAIKYTPPGGHVVCSVGERNGQVVTSISDDGIGIDEGDMPKLFSKFFRVDSSLTREEGGTGLGLSICRTIVELLGGSIWAESELGKGSTFRFSLPAAEVVETAGVAGKGKRPGVAKILVVDDEPQVAQLIEIYLRKEGYEVIKAFDGEQALEMAEAERPDLITLDIMMDHVDGFQVLERLKGTPTLKNIPVVVVSIVSDEKKGMKLGAAGYFGKPVNRKRLTQCINRLLSNKASKKVLVADDDADIRNLIGKQLLSRYDVRFASNGLEALQAVETDPPDVLILDLKMPEMDGYEVIERIKKSEQTAHVPIIVMTAYPIDRDKVHLLSYACEHFDKPFDMDAFGEAVGNALVGRGDG